MTSRADMERNRVPTASWRVTLEYKADDGVSLCDMKLQSKGDWFRGDAIKASKDIAWDLGLVLKMLMESGNLLGGGNYEELVEQFHDVFR